MEPLSDERWRQIDALLDEALDLDAEARAALLDAACADDPSLRRMIEHLLAAEAPAFLDADAADYAVPILPDVLEEEPDYAGRQVGPYCIVCEIGRGGMGTVYKARHDGLGRYAALKFLPPHLATDEKARARFLTEARVAAALDHPNICTIHDIGEAEDGRFFIAMAYYEGMTLKARIERGLLPVGLAIHFARQIAHGLSKAHERGIVHRDLKPANVIVTEDEAAIILDFGIAKMADVNLTKSGMRLGTVAYMSPEQARGEAVDHRTDIWSLGVVLYEMLAGRRPHEGPHEQAVIYRILHEPPAPLRSLRPDIPPALTRIVEKALAKEPARRYDTLAPLLRDLEGVDPSSGSSLPPAVTQINAPSPPAPPPLPPEGERRQATVVASFLSGYTPLVEHLSPEEVTQVMAQVHAQADEVAHRYGGVVNQCSGDVLVMLFGIPVTHEDDTMRAMRAARALHERVRALSDEIERRVGHPLHLATGLDTGRVTAQRSESGERLYRIAGSVAQTAMLLAAQADDDEVLASPESHHLLVPFFDAEACTPVRLKGHTDPVIPYRIGEASGVQSRLEATEQAGLAVYTGREKELAALQHSLAQTRQGEGQFVAVVGEAGLGKSRLLLEFRRQVDTEAVRLLQGRCQSYGTTIPYLPFIDALRGALGARGYESQAAPAEEIAARIRAVAPELEAFIPLYLHLLSLEAPSYPLPKHLEGEQFRLAMQEALAAFFTLSTAEQPLVMLLEDWHWADEASREALTQLVEMGTTHPLLVVVTYRPGYGLDWSTPPHPTPLHLKPLGVEASLVLLASVLGSERFPAEMGRLLHERTGGNPFFLEEITRALREEGTLCVEEGRVITARPLDQAQLPDTVQAVIRTRLHRMDRHAQAVMRLASVIGREFTRGVLEHVLPAETPLLSALETLRAAGLIQQTRVLPEAMYRFKHALMQEVAYESILPWQRKQFHGRVGAALETLYPDRLEEQADILAQHFSQTEAWDKAVRHGLAAARKAHRLSQFPEALRMFENAQRWLLRQPESPERQDALVEILLWQERLCETMGLRERQQALIDEMVALVEPGGTPAQCAAVYQRQGDLCTLLHRYAEAEPALDEALRLRRDIGDETGERNVVRSLGMLCWHADRLQEARAHMETALEIDRRRDDHDAVIGDLHNLGNVLKSMGRLDEAIDYLSESLALAERTGNQPKQVYAMHTLARIHYTRGDLEEAKALFRRASALGKENRMPFQTAYHLISLGNILWEERAFEESLECYRESVAISRRTRDAQGLSLALLTTSDLLVQLDRHDEARPYLEEAAALFAQLIDPQAEALVRCKLAVCHEHEHDDPAAMAAWGRARTISHREGDAAGELKALEGLAQVTRRHVAEASLALGYYAEALNLARRLEDLRAQGRLHNTMGILEWSRDAYEEALAHYQEALTCFQALDDAVHQALMLNSIGVTLQKLGRDGEAVVCLEEGATLSRQAGQALLEGHALAALGELAHDRGEYAEALRLFEQSLALRRAVADAKGEGWMHYHLARSSAACGELTRAREHTTTALDNATDRGDSALLAACQRLRSA